MRKIIFSLLFIVLIHPVFADSPMASSEEKEGKNLHLRILARHSKLDKFYQLPDLFGGLTDSPKVTIYIPAADWKKMTSKEQDLLSAYAASLIKTVQSNPLKYARIPESAPAAQRNRTMSPSFQTGSLRLYPCVIDPNS